MARVGRDVNNEIDQYPEGASERPWAPGMLPPGVVAMTSFIVASLDAVKAPFIAEPIVAAIPHCLNPSNKRGDFR